jgi:hypothetical protein
MNNHFIKLREKYPQFIYSGYSVTDSDKALILDFHFVIPGLTEFTPHWEIDKTSSFSVNINDERLNNLVFSLGMVELVSYWKTTCSPNVRIDCANLSKEQSDWWKKLYIKGLGEFFYRNEIEVNEDIISITSKSCHNHICKCNIIPDNTNERIKALIPIGGGKDSAVTLELLSECAERFCYIINPRKATLDTVRVSGIPSQNVITAKRTLDKNMLELNERGFLNGHTPFSATVAFSSVLAAYINKLDYVALSNESSANEPTVIGTDINHQYSKSVEFEADFINYELKHIASGVKYFSFLRPLKEIAVAKIFSRQKKYHPVFRSCNVGSKDDTWCASCSKCLFVYIILSPFLSEKEVVDIFGKNMLSDMNMLTDFEKLIGREPEKPFECVGSIDEVNAALQEVISQYKTKGLPLPKLPEIYEGIGVTKEYNISDLCDSYNDENYVPECFSKVLKGALELTENE